LFVLVLQACIPLVSMSIIFNIIPAVAVMDIVFIDFVELID